MRLILKILAAPLVAVLAIITWLFSFMLNLSSVVFGVAGTLLGICGFIVIFMNSVTIGIIILVIALLVSPFGLPMLAAWMLGQLQRLRYAIQDIIYG